MQLLSREVEQERETKERQSYQRESEENDRVNCMNTGLAA